MSIEVPPKHWNRSDAGGPVQHPGSSGQERVPTKPLPLPLFEDILGLKYVVRVPATTAPSFSGAIKRIFLLRRTTIPHVVQNSFGNDQTRSGLFTGRKQSVPEKKPHRKIVQVVCSQANATM